MMQLMVATWLLSSAAVALGVAIAWDKMFGTFSCGSRLAPHRSKRLSQHRPALLARKEETRA